MPKRPTGPRGRAASSAKAKKKAGSSSPVAEPRNYDHPEATSPLRPDVGVQKQFRKKKPPKIYRYDPSLSPTLQWDEQPARERGEALIRRIQEAGSLEEAKAAAAELAAMSRPFLEWAGKAERGAFEVPTLPLFVHERLSTRAILGDGGGAARGSAIRGGPSPTRCSGRTSTGSDGSRLILGDALLVVNSHSVTGNFVKLAA